MKWMWDARICRRLCATDGRGVTVISRHKKAALNFPRHNLTEVRVRTKMPDTVASDFEQALTCLLLLQSQCGVSTLVRMERVEWIHRESESVGPTSSVQELLNLNQQSISSCDFISEDDCLAGKKCDRLSEIIGKQTLIMKYSIGSWHSRNLWIFLKSL